MQHYPHDSALQPTMKDTMKKLFRRSKSGSTTATNDHQSRRQPAQPSHESRDGYESADMSQFAENLEFNGTEGIAFHMANVRRKSETSPKSLRISDLQMDDSAISARKSLPEALPAPENFQPFIEDARNRLDDCFKHHTSCSKTPQFSRVFGGGSSHQIIDLDAESAMPTRLLQIHSEWIQLITVQNTVGYVDYVCLSHRWGADEHCKTVQKTKDQFSNDGIKIAGLPRAFGMPYSSYEAWGILTSG